MLTLIILTMEGYGGIWGGHCVIFFFNPSTVNNEQVLILCSEESNISVSSAPTPFYSELKPFASFGLVFLFAQGHTTRRTWPPLLFSPRLHARKQPNPASSALAPPGVP